VLHPLLRLRLGAAGHDQAGRVPVDREGKVVRSAIQGKTFFADISFHFSIICMRLSDYRKRNGRLSAAKRHNKNYYCAVTHVQVVDLSLPPLSLSISLSLAGADRPSRNVGEIFTVAITRVQLSSATIRQCNRLAHFSKD
jgi:hypothetical protein